MDKKKLGEFGEDKAVEYLQKKGYKILERNFSYSRGEIDIIVSDQKYIVFVEVKLRRTEGYGTPQEAVDQRKQGKIKNTARYYLLSKGVKKKKIRFDVISIQIKNGRGYLRHFKNAF